MQSTLACGAAGLVAPVVNPSRASPHAAEEILPGLAGPAGYRLSRQIPTHFYDGKQCWTHPRAGIVPSQVAGGAPRVVMTMNSLQVSGSDVFQGVFGLHTGNLGQSWSEPTELKSLAPRYETIDGARRPVALSDFTPAWHAASGKLLGTGHTVVYTPEWKVTLPRPRHTAYSIYDPATHTWQAWQKMEMPQGEKFHNAGAGCTQRFDLPGGEILLPIAFRPSGKNSSGVTVVRCGFDGDKLSYLEHGDELFVNDKTRGLHEPSITRFNGRYLLTIRNDKQGFVTHGRDGLKYAPLAPWTFDDGSDLGNYNTQQHWVTHAGGLFLVYTRRGANNDHVFRHRAPLFMAQVNPDRLCVIRETERVLVPERGARLGNFGVVHVSPQETWVTTAEWMQTWGPNHVMAVDNPHGSNGSVWVARIAWNTPGK